MAHTETEQQQHERQIADAFSNTQEVLHKYRILLESLADETERLNPHAEETFLTAIRYLYTLTETMRIRIGQIERQDDEL